MADKTVNIDVRLNTANAKVKADQLNSSLSNLQNNGNKLASIFNMFGSTGSKFGSVISNVTGKVGNFSKLLSSAGSGSSAMAEGLAGGATSAAGLGAALTALLPVLAAVAAALAAVAAVKGALDLSEEADAIGDAANKLGTSSQSYQKWADMFQFAGLDTSSYESSFQKLKKAQASSASSFSALGISETQAQSMSTTELYDLTISKLQKVENQVQKNTIAYEIFGKSAGDLNAVLGTSAEEFDALNAGLEAMGYRMSDDLIAKSGELQDSLDVLKKAFAGLKNVLAPLLEPIIKVVNWLIVAIGKISVFLQALLGISNQSTKATSSASTNMSNYSNSVKQADDNVKKLKGSLSGFDQLNNITFSDSSSASALTDVDFGDTNESLFELSDGLAEAMAKVQEFKDKIEDSEFFQGIKAIWDGACEFFTKLGEDIGSVWDDYIAPVWDSLKECVGYIVEKFSESGPLQAVLKTFQMYWAVLFAELATIWDTFWAIFSTVWNTVIAIIESIVAICTGDFDKLKEIWSDWWEKIKDIWSKWWEKIKTRWEDIKTKFAGIKDSLSEWWEKIKTTCSEKWDRVKEWFNEHVKPKFTKEYWQEKWETMKTACKEKLDETKEKIEEKWENIKTWFNEHIKPKFTKEYWKEKFTAIKDAMNDKLTELKQKITDKWTEIKNWFTTYVAPKFTATFWATKLSGIKEGAKTALNGFISKIEAAINNIVNKLNNNGIIKWLDKAIGNNDGTTFSTVYIPRLAKGGIVNKSTFANIGEAGPEAIVPLANNTEWMQVFARVLVNEMSNNQSDVVLNVDGKTLARTVVNDINKISRQSGRLGLNLG